MKSDPMRYQFTKRHVSAKTYLAMQELDRRGFRFLVHFGIDNAEQRLKDMNQAMEEDRLEEYLRTELGIV